MYITIAYVFFFCFAHALSGMESSQPSTPWQELKYHAINKWDHHITTMKNIHYAVATNNTSLVNLRLLLGDDPNKAYQFPGGQIVYPLIAACESDIRQLIARHQIVKNRCHRDGIAYKDCPLDIVRIYPIPADTVSGINTSILALLLQAGAHANHLSPFGCQESPLHYACRENNKNAVTLLLTFAADPNMRDRFDCHPLSMTSDPEIASLLHTFGADLTKNIKDLKQLIHNGLKNVNTADVKQFKALFSSNDANLIKSLNEELFPESGSALIELVSYPVNWYIDPSIVWKKQNNTDRLIVDICAFWLAHGNWHKSQSNKLKPLLERTQANKTAYEWAYENFTTAMTALGESFYNTPYEIDTRQPCHVCNEDLLKACNENIILEKVAEQSPHLYQIYQQRLINDSNNKTN